MRQVIVHLPAHAIDLLLHGGGHLQLASCLRALSLVRENRQRRLQPVREVAGFRDRATNGLFTAVEQRVEVVHERLHFRRVGSIDATVAALVQSGETRSKVVDRRHATPHLQKPGDHRKHREQDDKRPLNTSCTAKANEGSR